MCIRDSGKRDRIYNMVKSMKEEGVPIDGIGMQGHYNVYGPSMEDEDAALTKYSTIGDTCVLRGARRFPIKLSVLKMRMRRTFSFTGT